jgi:lysophospholipase L1-like esterase
MHRRLHLCFATLTVSWLALSTALLGEGPARPLPALELQDGDGIVFLGDSITHQRLYTQYVEDYFYTRLPHLRLRLHNAGVGGARAWDALQRFDPDVAAYQPKYVTILLGMNDGTYQPFNQAVFDTYRQDMTALLERIRALGATPIPMTPTMFDARADRAKEKNTRPPESTLLYNSVLAYYGTWLRDVATEQGLGFVDMWGPLNNITLEQRKTDPAFTLIRDAVHPGPDGQVVMAAAIINDLGLPRQVSKVVISLPAAGQPRVRAANGTLSDLTVTDDGLAFTFTAQALPWVVPEEARLGARLCRLGHRLGKEGLEIHGLHPGQYALFIDDVEVGRYSSEALERHIELQENDKTPQFQQALEVALLNKQRNEGPIGKLRSEWSQFQQYARTRRTVSEQPGNEQAAKQLAALEDKISGIEERVARHNAEAKAIEDQIFQKNQPQPRRYVLKRVETPATRPAQRRPAAAPSN